jgi:hypothetical protein
MAPMAERRKTHDMPAAEKKAPLNRASTRQAEIGPVALAAFTSPLRLSLRWALPSQVLRPMAVLDARSSPARPLSDPAGN